MPYTVFQPLYLYGDYTGKDCEQWFMDRILRCATRSCFLPNDPPSPVCTHFCTDCPASACRSGHAKHFRQTCWMYVWDRDQASFKTPLRRT